MTEDLNDVVGSKWALLHKVKFLSQLTKKFKHNKSTSSKEFDRCVFVCAYCAD